ncbi:ExbD/TolR family protein [Thiolapillus brandeum]|uniref:Biopolymer transport protein ExbD n=1 Tax=Thiolapillus brandeum TaxID=1076588 RepID=A0A7U6GIZ5_9GAMM|nr:biopolymer transporter ExbD [Thiolapillus brandeum]BAO44489.1 biopolymer transport protein ExbD [Thiolapillus brandeum]
MNIRPTRRSRRVLVDMTPLIDVVFLLLIFFMVSTTFDKQTAIKVDLPEASNQTEENKQPQHIAISIDAKGHFYLDDQELVTHDLATLKRALGKAAVDNKEIPIIVTSDKQAPFQAVMTVMDAAGQLGLTRLSFLARATAAEGE